MRTIFASLFHHQHPDQQEGEEFVRNVDKRGFQEIIYPNKRRGIHVLSHGEYGHTVDQDKTHPDYRLFPVFAPKTEIDAIRRANHGMFDLSLVFV